jgi:hypothetical protein
MVSRNGIYYNLEISPFISTVDGLTFVFSSKIHKDKFDFKCDLNRAKLARSLSIRFNIDISINNLSDILLYKKIETRGFLLINEKGEQICENNLKYDGGKLKSKV